MTIQNLDFGTSANNDGEKLLTAFDKIEDNFVALYAGDGTVTHAATTVASAATCDIGAASTDHVLVTGTTTITSFGTSANKWRLVLFQSALTLTHNATSLILPGGSNLAVTAGASAWLSSDADGNWRLRTYQSGSGFAVGDVVGPTSVTDNAIARYDSTTGKLLQNSIVSIDDSGNIAPVTTDTGGLGTSSLMWSDLFLASGAVVNWNAGDVTLTHSANTLTMAGGTLVLPASGLQVGDSNPFSDSSGTLTLQNVDALDATTESTIEAAIDTLANLVTVQGHTVTLTGAFIRSGAHSLTLTTTATTDVTLPSTGTLATLAGSETLTSKSIDLTNNTLVGSVAEFNAALESADFYTTGGTDVALADGGTGASLADPGADRMFFWDDSESTSAWLTPGDGLAVSTTTLGVTVSGLSAPASFGSGDKLWVFEGGALKVIDYDDLPGAGAGLSNIVEDVTPQLGGDLDANTFSILMDDSTGIKDSSGNEHLIFQQVASAVNYLEITNAATGNAASLAATGSDTDVSLLLDAKGAGFIQINDDLDANGKFIRMDDATGIKDDSGNEQLIFQKTASAVNEWEMTNAATGNAPVLQVTGGDTNIIARINGKGTGGVEIEGTATNDNATAGYVGEYISSSVASGSSVSLTSGVAADVTSIELTAGDWDVHAVGCLNVTNGSTSITSFSVSINTTSATLPTAPNGGGMSFWRAGAFVPGTTVNGIMLNPSMRISVSSTTTVYLVAFSGFTVSTASAYGFIGARRVR